MVRGLIVAAITLAQLAFAEAADLHGVSMPDTFTADGMPLSLNGIGLRTFSIFEVPIYVAGLYLQQRSNNSDAILHSNEDKLLHIRFLRDVSVEDARKAWLEGFDNNCKAPCHLDPQDVQRFLAAVPPIRQGDESMLLFTRNGVSVTLNGRQSGVIPDAHFGEVMLSTFIGQVPPTPRLKRELLGGPH
jgi:hypothetical protein